MTSPATKLMMAGGVGYNAPPPDIGSQVARWWATDLVGTYANNDPVGSWTDDVGSFTVSASGSARPTFLTSGVNGKPAVSFDGTDDVLRYAGTLTTSTLGVVIAIVELDEDNTTATFWSSSDEGSTDRYIAGEARQVSGNFKQYTNTNNGGGATNNFIHGDTTLDSGTSTPYWLEWSSSGFAYVPVVNLTTQSLTIVAGSDDGDWFGDVTLRDNFCLGALQRTTVSNYFKGRLMYLTVATAQLSNPDRTALYSSWAVPYYGI